MATTTKPDTPPSPLLGLHPEERRRRLLDSLKEGYSGVPKVSSRVSKEVSRYVSQFTSERWREGIWKQADETVDKTKLVIHGYDLQCEDYRKEQEMISRWHIVERELHLPDLEEIFMQKRDAKTQSGARVPKSQTTTSTQDAKTSTEPTTEDIRMDEGQDSSRKNPDGMETSTIVGGQESSTGAGKLQSEVEMSEETEVSTEAGKPGSEVEASEAKIAAETVQHKLSGLFQKTRKPESEVEMSEEAEGSTEVGKPESEVMEVSGDTEVASEVLKKESSGMVQESSPKIRDSSSMKDSRAVSDKAMETSNSNVPESSGEKVAIPTSESSGVVEVVKFEDKTNAETIQECNKAEINSETDLKPSEATSNCMKSRFERDESSATEAKESAKENATSESSEVSMTSKTNKTENVAESSAKSESLGVSEVKDQENEEKVITMSENSEVLVTSETDTKSSEITKAESVRDSNKNSESSVSEAKDASDNKIASETVQESSKISKTSETDMEITDTSSRGKRKADSMSEDDIDEKRLKKISTE